MSSRTMMDSQTIQKEIGAVSEEFGQERRDRQLRRELLAADFDRIRDTGYLLTGVPVEQGGIWQSVAESARPICDIVRTLAHGDSSVALVSTMHPAVLSFWLASPEADPEYQEAWDTQREWIFETALGGDWWGTITSEPGSGGDITRTKSIALHKDSSDLEFTLSGQKHFGSGSGIMSYMITTAIPEGSTKPDLFFMDLRDVSWDGSDGIELISLWDGHGMTATQSHSMQFRDYPMTRCAWPGQVARLGKAANPFINCLFTAVIVGIVEVAFDTARTQMEKRSGSSRAYEQVEWTKIEMETWLVQQAYEGMLRALEADEDSLRVTLMGKAKIAELAESVTRRICRVLGGGTYSRHNPFGFWFEDVRALGFLRPPWGLAYDNMNEASFPSTE
jgi:alkylation response protein AidB-like acyl-CoA dehydrogenase